MPSSGTPIPRHPRITCSLSLSKSSVSPNPSSSSQLPRTCTRVHSNLLANDETIGYELADSLAGVGVGDFVHFIRIEPDLALAAANDGRRKALLSAEIDPGRQYTLAGEQIGRRRGIQSCADSEHAGCDQT